MNLADIVGQQRVIKTLEVHLQTGRLHHAYLFSGPAGVGKKTTGRAFARALLCSQQGDACGECGSCRRFASGNHPDYQEYHPEGGTIGIDLIRELRNSINYRPYEADHRVFLITEVETMTAAASNSLLKSLEEPPPYVVIILTTTNRETVLPTIRSRSLLLQFNHLPEQVIYDKLEQVIPDKERVKVLAGMAQGSLGLAYRFAQDAEFAERREDLLKQLTCMQKGSFWDVYRLVKSLQTDWEDNYEFVFQILLAWFRDLYLLKEGGEVKFLNIDFKETLRKEEKKWRKEDIEKAITALAATKNMIKKKVNRQLATEALLLKINRWRK